jgi:carbonic anhydrase
MQKLLAGYQRFRAHGWPAKRREFEELADNGQAPKSLVIACIDSRVDPAMIFDAAPGEMLTVRNVANLVPPYAPDDSWHGTSAALEFGVKVLEVRHLIVLGHGLCGGVKALIEGSRVEANEFIAPWMSIAQPACARAMSAAPAAGRQLICEHEIVKVSLANLMTFPWISERVAAGKIMLHGAWFDIRIGELMMLQADGTFSPAVHKPMGAS